MDEIKISGVIDNIIYANAENGYTVLQLLVDDDANEDTIVCCVGYMPDINLGESLRVMGRAVKHPSYGDQLEIISYQKSLPETEKAIERYLSSGIIKGVRKRTAKKIVEKFGRDTLFIIDTEPQRLAEIKGITISKATEIGAVFREQNELTRAVMFLQEYGVSISYAAKIFKKYKEKTIATVQKNPYTLADEVWGIGFKTADSIAQKLGVAPNSPHRICSGIKYVLDTAANNGHTYLPEVILLKETCALLETDEAAVVQNLMQMHVDSRIWMENSSPRRIYLNFFYYAESYIAKRLVEMSVHKAKTNPFIEAEIRNIELAENIKFAEGQLNAIKTAMSEGVFVITGGPGTGKTTIINAIIGLLEQEGLKIELAAPTGKASKRMTEATGREARTIHRLLGTNFLNEDRQRQSFAHDEEDPIDADCIIIDEVSMVDVPLMYYLIKAVSAGTKLILVGDADQLPSVGAGNVLHDILDSGIVPCAMLTEIFRQAQQSAIITNAHKINNGIYPDMTDNKSDFFYMQRYNSDALLDTLAGLVSERLPKYLDCEPMDIKVLTPMRKSPIGMHNLNALLQNVLNPPSITKAEKEFRGTVFRKGDRVMQIKNNYDMPYYVLGANGRVIEDGAGVFNGDEGIISFIDNDNKSLEVTFDDNRLAAYDFTQLDELELAYAVTIHKSQGSEYKAVIMPLLNGPEMLMTRNLLYTGITRAKELAVVLGSKETVFRMVDNNRQIDRYTGLALRIKEFGAMQPENVNFTV
ncbi:MAG: ATP-dependent RecD-like DNA helicase [Firmicutes bacterium]|nr:ATP-dependent RecD-like DNA helicase [Bacillota bacterium]